MASFTEVGLDDLMLSFEEIAELPEHVISDMLIAQGEVLRTAQEKKIKQLELVDTEQLAGSIAINKKLRGNKFDEQFITVYPKGTRETTGGVGATSKTTNNEVGFVNEFGAPHRNIKPTQWMRQANEESAEEGLKASERVYDRFLKSKGF